MALPINKFASRQQVPPNSISNSKSNSNSQANHTENISAGTTPPILLEQPGIAEPYAPRAPGYIPRRPPRTAPMPSTTGIHVLPDVDLIECGAHYFIDCVNSSKNDPIARLRAFAPKDVEQTFVSSREESKNKSEQTGARSLLLDNDVRLQLKDTVLEGLGGCFVLAQPEKGALGIQKQPNPNKIYRDITNAFDEAIRHHDNACDKTTGNGPDNNTKRNSIEVAIEIPPRPSRRTIHAVMDAIFAGSKKAVDANIEPKVGIVGSNKKLDRLIQREKQTRMKQIQQEARALQQEAFALRTEGYQYRDKAAKELADPEPWNERRRKALATSLDASTRSLVSSIFALDQASCKFTLLALNSAEDAEAAAEFKEAAIQAKRDAVRPMVQYAKLLEERARTTGAATNEMANKYYTRAIDYARSTDYENWSAERLPSLRSHAEQVERVKPSSMSEAWKTISDEYLFLAKVTSSESKAEEYRGLADECLKKVSPKQAPRHQLKTLIEETKESLDDFESSDQIRIPSSSEEEVVDAPAIYSRILTPVEEAQDAEKLVNYAIGTAISECDDLVRHRLNLGDDQAKTVVAAINQMLEAASQFEQAEKNGEISKADKAVYQKAAIRSKALAHTYLEFFAADLDKFQEKMQNVLI